MTTNLDPYACARSAVKDHNACQVIEELGFIGSVVRRGAQVHTVLEIGTEYGGTLWYWSTLTEPDGYLVSLDLNQSKNATDEGALGQVVHKVEGNARDEATRVAVEALGPYDFIFIDGDHEPPGVMSDWLEYAVPMLKRTGIVAFHDSHGYAHSVDPVLDICGRSVLRLRGDIVEHNGWEPGVAVVLPPADTGLFPEVPRG